MWFLQNMEHMEQEAHKWFEKIKDKIDNTSSAITVSTEVISTGASPQVAIVEYAENKNIDLIVVGTRGMSGLRKLLLGRRCFGCNKVFTLSCIGCKMINHNFCCNPFRIC